MEACAGASDHDSHNAGEGEADGLALVAPSFRKQIKCKITRFDSELPRA